MTTDRQTDGQTEHKCRCRTGVDGVDAGVDAAKLVASYTIN